MRPSCLRKSSGSTIFLVNHQQCLLATLFYQLTVNYISDHQTSLVDIAVVVADGVMAPWALHEGIADVVHLGRVSVHPTEDLAMGDPSHDCCAGVRVGRRPTTGREIDLGADDDLARTVR